MKTIKTITLASLILSIFFIHSCSGKRGVHLESPDGSYEFACYLNEEADEIYYSLNFHGKEIIQPSRLGFVFSGEDDEQGDIIFKDVTRKNVDSSWRPVYGEKSEYPEVYAEVILDMQEGARHCKLHIRAYNEGVAFRHEFPDGDAHIIEEKTEFALPAETILWASDRAQSEIYKILVNEVKETIDRPLLMQLPDSLFVAIGEGGLIDFARMKIARSAENPDEDCQVGGKPGHTQGQAGW